MHIYRKIWSVLVGVLAGIGCLVVVFRLSVIPVLVTASVVAVLSIVMTVLLRDRQRPRSGRQIAASAGRRTGCAVGVLGLWTLAGGGATILIAATLFLLSPWLVGRIVGKVRPQAAAAADTVADLVPAPNATVGDLTDRQLCEAWQQSSDLFDASSRTRQRAELASRRQSYLDELERRHPAEFACWLYNSPGPGDDPGPFLTSAS
ncbi:hypothetical protein [Microlunatus soli]|uniref:Uncharacterized protein n=1 Tax=Microlunatus soli TaxID=630515 RepID=A0A1H1N5G3_9ACTN|nr:hypothetical protein [Microlunatus soli]SDR93965.1 hypothetical protein SAMN04489812_0381 [Microlunatus soli]